MCMRPHVVHARQSCLLQLPPDPSAPLLAQCPRLFHVFVPLTVAFHHVGNQVAASRPALSRPQPTATGVGTGAAAGTSEEAAGAPVSDPILALLDEFGHTSQGRTGRRGSLPYSRLWDSLLESYLSTPPLSCLPATPLLLTHKPTVHTLLELYLSTSTLSVVMA